MGKYAQWLILIVLLFEFMPTAVSASPANGCGSGAVIEISHYGYSTWQLVMDRYTPVANRPTQVSVSDGVHTTTQPLVWRNWSGGTKVLAEIRAFRNPKRVGPFACTLKVSTGWRISADGRTYVR